MSPDLTAATGGFSVERTLGVSISGDSAVYMVGTMDLVSTVDSLSGSFMEANMGLGGNFNAGFGNGFGGNSIVIARDGTQATAAETFSQVGAPTLLVLRLNQTNGAATLWVNPNLSTTEGLNTASATATLATVNGSTFDSVIFRGGDFDAPAPEIDYTGFSVYYGGDTPFSAVPEPSSTLLLSMAGLVLARRRR